jgi:manganese/zinc/iron transport system permease protein
MSSALVIILVGSLVGASCALVGSFLVLRKMALLGDAISHAVLLGIVAAFLLTGSRAPLPMVIGAGAVGVLTVFLVEVLNRSRRIHEDASIGVVFPALFSIGVILVSRYAAQIDLDIECVLYGEIGLTPYDTLTWGGRDIGPKALWVNGAVLLFDLALVLLLYKELKLSSFDRDLAAATGFSPVLLHYLLMVAVSVTIVAAFESVGAILVVAMLVVPPATAYLLTNRLSIMLALGVVIGIASSAAGYGMARWYDASIAGCMAAFAGAVFTAVLVFSPSHGLLASALARRRLGLRFEEQILLLHLKGEGESSGPDRSPDVARRFGWSRGRWERVVRNLLREGLVKRQGSELLLTPEGRQQLEEAGTTLLAHRDG